MGFNNKVIYFIAYFITPLRNWPLIKPQVHENSYIKSFIKIQPGHNADPLVIFSSSGCLQFWLSTNALTASATALRCPVHHTDINLIISFQPN